MIRTTFFAFSALLVILIGCTERVSRDSNPRILAMGDSLLASHGVSNRAISDAVERSLGEPVIDRSVMGARMIYNLPISGSLGISIPKQFTPGKWDWVILNGGGNDLWFGCGCLLCDRKLGKLIAKDGSSGKIPKLIAKLRNTGARVVYVGYLRSPGIGSPIEHCKDEGNRFEARIANFANVHEGVYFVSIADLVPHGDRSFFVADMIHPSVKASALIGARVAKTIHDADQLARTAKTTQEITPLKKQ